MIFDRTDVGRYIFIFDINDRTPFDGTRYFTRSANVDWQFIEVGDILGLTKSFDELAIWLSERTRAFRIARVMMMPITPTIPNHHNATSAVAVHVPEELSVLFRLFWYGA